MIKFYLVVIIVNNIQDLKKTKNIWFSEVMVEPKNLKNHLYKIHGKITVCCNKCEYKTTFETLINKSYWVIHGKMQYYCYKCKYKTGFDIRE